MIGAVLRVGLATLFALVLPPAVHADAELEVHGRRQIEDLIRLRDLSTRVAFGNYHRKQEILIEMIMRCPSA